MILLKMLYSVLNFKLQVGQNQDMVSPCSRNIIPKHLGHCPISSLTDFLNLVPRYVFQKITEEQNQSK